MDKSFRAVTSFQKSEAAETENFLVSAFKFGMKGFITFFITFLIISTIAYFIGVSQNFEIGIKEVISSIAGFILLFLVKIFEFKKEESVDS